MKSYAFDLRWLKIRSVEYLEFSKIKHVIEILSHLKVEPSQNRMHMTSREHVSFDDFMSHLTLTPSPYGKIRPIIRGFPFDLKMVKIPPGQDFTIFLNVSEPDRLCDIVPARKCPNH